MREDRRLELLQLAAGIEAEVLDQGAAHAAERVERVGLAPGAVERAHQLRVQPLAVGVLGRQRLELADERGVGAGRERRRRCAPPARRAADRRAGRPPPPRARAAARRRAAARGTARAPRASSADASPRLPGRAGTRDERLEALEVELARLERDRVARGVRDDPIVRPERAPQPRDVDLQRLRRRRRRVLAPQHVDQPRGRDRLLAMRQQQRRQQRALLGGRQLDRAGWAADPERPEDREVHPLYPAVTAHATAPPHDGAVLIETTHLDADHPDRGRPACPGVASNTTSTPPKERAMPWRRCNDHPRGREPCPSVACNDHERGRDPCPCVATDHHTERTLIHACTSLLDHHAERTPSMP